MTTRDRDTSMASLRRWESWVLFAALMLIIIGAVNVLQGIIGLIYRNRTIVVQDQLYVVNLTGWAWTVLIFGAVLVVVGAGLLSGRTWARMAAIVVVAIHAIAQIAWLSAYPIWGLLMLALDIVVLYALTARWPGAESRTWSSEYEPPKARGGDHDRDTAGAERTARERSPM
jgi:hypothetical protein